MKTILFAAYLLCAASVAGMWFEAYESHQDRVYQNETERSYKGVYLQLMANGVVCRGS